MKIKTTKNRVDEFIKSTPNTQEVVNNSKTLKCRTSIQVKEEVADCDGGEIFYVPVVYVNIFEKWSFIIPVSSDKPTIKYEII